MVVVVVLVRQPLPVVAVVVQLVVVPEHHEECRFESNLGGGLSLALQPPPFMAADTPSTCHKSRRAWQVARCSACWGCVRRFDR